MQVGIVIPAMGDELILNCKFGMKRDSFVKCCRDMLNSRGESTTGRVPSAAGVDARRRDAEDVGAHRRGALTQQMPPRRRNPKGAWGLRAISSLLVVDDVHRHRHPPRALTSPRKTHARDLWYFHHVLLEGGCFPIGKGRPACSEES